MRIDSQCLQAAPRLDFRANQEVERRATLPRGSKSYTCLCHRAVPKFVSLGFTLTRRHITLCLKFTLLPRLQSVMAPVLI